LAGARVTVSRGLVVENQSLGVASTGAGSRVVISDSAVVATSPSVRGTFGRGLEANAGGALEATRVLVADAREVGVMASGPATTASLVDVLVARVVPSQRGFGAGAMAVGGARLDARRLALADVHGVGLAAIPLDDALNGRVGDARVAGTDVFVHRVRSSTIQFDDSGRTATPVGRLVAYGLHVGPGCALDASQTVLTAGGYGFFAASNSAFALRDGVVTGQLDSAGASNNGANMLVLDRVERHGNAVDDVLRQVDLPEAAALPTPTPVCIADTCM
jgi:hypothetical protein